jgi:hypothetical protein
MNLRDSWRSSESYTCTQSPSPIDIDASDRRQEHRDWHRPEHRGWHRPEHRDWYQHDDWHRQEAQNQYPQGTMIRDLRKRSLVRRWRHRPPSLIDLLGEDIEES